MKTKRAEKVMGFFSNKNKSIDPKCEYCMHARIPEDRIEALCPQKGVVALDYSCKKFKYDPLKKVPRKITFNADFTEDDFKI